MLVGGRVDVPWLPSIKLSLAPSSVSISSVQMISEEWQPQVKPPRKKLDPETPFAFPALRGQYSPKRCSLQLGFPTRAATLAFSSEIQGRGTRGEGTGIPYSCANTCGRIQIPSAGSPWCQHNKPSSEAPKVYLAGDEPLGVQPGIWECQNEVAELHSLRCSLPSNYCPQRKIGRMNTIWPVCKDM